MPNDIVNSSQANIALPAERDQPTLLCDACKYNLSGLPVAGNNALGKPCHQCPECGHLQPVDSPRRFPPTRSQITRRWIFRVLASLLLAFTLMMWFGYGSYSVAQVYVGGVRSVYRGYLFYQRSMDVGDAAFAFAMGLFFGGGFRMILFQKMKPWMAGLILAFLACLAMSAGAKIYLLAMGNTNANARITSWYFIAYLAVVSVSILAGAMIANKIQILRRSPLERQP